MSLFNYKFALGAAIALYGSITLASAQCPAPTAIGSPSITHASCPGNGQITVGSITPTSLPAGDYYQYALYDTLGNEIKPWQASNALTNLQAGVYDIRVRRVCSTPAGFSTAATRRATVNNTEVMPFIQGITLERQDHGCNSGRFQVTVSGSAPVTVALVSSLAAPEPVSSYVRPPGASGKFDSLAAGTYYVRAYNACGNAVTQAFNVPAYTTPVTLQSAEFAPLGCDSVLFSFTPNRHFQIFGTRDTSMVKAWVTWPNGQTDTVKLPNTGSTGSSLTAALFLTHISRIDPLYNTEESFWENLNNYPYTIQYGYRSLCGNVYTGTYSLYRPQQRDLLLYYIDNGSTCDSSTAYFRISYSRTAPNQNLYHYYRSIHNVQYSLDTGATWQAAQTGNTISSNTLGTSSIYLMAKRAQPVLLKVAICGDTLTKLITPPALPALTSSLSTYPLYSCLGKSSMFITKGNAYGDSLGIQMLTAPAGQPLVPYFVTQGSIDQPQLANILPGQYTVRIWDTIDVECPRFIDRTITLTPYNLTFNYTQNCNGSLTVYETTSPQIPSFAWFKLKVYDAQGNQVLLPAGYTGSSSSPNTIVVPAAQVTALPDGTYTLRVYKSTGANTYLDTCTIVEKTWVKGANNLNLIPSRFIPGCPGNSGSIIALAQGGRAPYNFQLTGPSGNVITPAQAGGNIYNNLATGTTYNLQVIDSCGTVINRTMSIEDDLAIFTSATTMPCINDDITLFVDSIPGVRYQWYKNGTLLTGDTTSRILISDIQHPADSGEYKAEVRIGSCTVLLAGFVLDPTLCGMPLQVDMGSFKAYAVHLQSKLEWATYSEQNNKGFTVERSNDGRSWQKLGFVISKASNGNSTTTLSYDFMDSAPGNGNNFYRLKQTDMDGSYAYSPVRQVYIGKNQSLRIHPNPTRGRVEISQLQGGEMIRIIAVTGQVVRELRAAGSASIISLDGLSDGLYQVNVISADGNSITGKVLKVK